MLFPRSPGLGVLARYTTPRLLIGHVLSINSSEIIESARPRSSISIDVGTISVLSFVAGNTIALKASLVGLYRCHMRYPAAKIEMTPRKKKNRLMNFF